MKTVEQTVVLRELIPSKGMHIKSKVTGEIYESSVYLGKDDSPENYEETNESPPVVENPAEKEIIHPE